MSKTVETQDGLRGREWPMVKRVIDLEIEKNKELTTYIKGTVERRYKKSA